MAAPVCHVPTGTPDAGTPFRSLPAIPVAKPDLQSLTNTVNALRQAMILLTNQNTTNNGSGAGQISGFRTDPNKRPQWTELRRRVQKVRIFQNDDPTSDNWVDVEQINQLIMVDRNTGQTWTWDRKRR